MLRSQSVDRLSYQNIASRIQRIRATANGHSNSQARNVSTANSSCNIQQIIPLHPKIASSPRGAFKMKQNKDFGVGMGLNNFLKQKEIDNRISHRNVGIKKKNQIQIHQILGRSSAQNQGNLSYKRIEEINSRAQVLERILSPRFSCPQTQEFHPRVKVPNFSNPPYSQTSSIFSSSKQKDVPLDLLCKQIDTSSHSEFSKKISRGGLESGKIYCYQELSKYY